MAVVASEDDTVAVVGPVVELAAEPAVSAPIAAVGPAVSAPIAAVVAVDIDTGGLVGPAVVGPVAVEGLAASGVSPHEQEWGPVALLRLLDWS